jgi:type IV pilus assembly protein PilA
MLNRLAKLREERAQGDKGFTLIELLVVVVIIGILIAIAIPLYLNYQKGAKNKSAQSDVRNAVVTVQQCIADNNGALPATAPTGSGTKDANLVFTCGTGSGNTQTANVSTGNTLTFSAAAAPDYTIAGTNADGGKTYTYSSSTGKIVQS